MAIIGVVYDIAKNPARFGLAVNLVIHIRHIRRRHDQIRAIQIGRLEYFAPPIDLTRSYSGRDLLLSLQVRSPEFSLPQR